MGWLRGLRVGTLQGKVASEQQMLQDTFEQLQQFLREQEGILMAQLDQAHQELTKEHHKYFSSVSERRSLLDTLVAEIEKKCDQPVVEFLMVSLHCPPGCYDTPARLGTPTWHPLHPGAHAAQSLGVWCRLACQRTGCDTAVHGVAGGSLGLQCELREGKGIW